MKNDFNVTYTKLDGFISSWAAWVYYAVALIARHEAPDSPLANHVEALAKSVWFGHHEPLLIQLMELDVSRELLRDDVLELFRALGRPRFLRLLRGHLSQEEIRRALLPGVTRMPEEDVVRVVYEITARRRKPV